MTKKATLLLFDLDTDPAVALKAIREAVQKGRQEAAEDEEPKVGDPDSEPSEGEDSAE